MTTSLAGEEEIGKMLRVLRAVVVEAVTASTETDEDIAVVRLAFSSAGVAMTAVRAVARNTSVMVNFIVTVVVWCNDGVMIVSWLRRRMLFCEKYQVAIENE